MGYTAFPKSSKMMIKIIRGRLSAAELKSFLGRPYSNMVKFVVDLEKEILALGGELHADSEALLLEEGSAQENLWGGNYYPANSPEEKIQYTSFINIRPALGNKSMEITDEKRRARMKAVVEKLLS